MREEMSESACISPISKIAIWKAIGWLDEVEDPCVRSEVRTAAVRHVCSPSAWHDQIFRPMPLAMGSCALLSTPTCTSTNTRHDTNPMLRTIYHNRKTRNKL